MMKIRTCTERFLFSNQFHEPLTLSQNFGRYFRASHMWPKLRPDPSIAPEVFGLEGFPRVAYVVQIASRYLDRPQEFSVSKAFRA